jgi:hypothetical protein
VIGVFFQAIGLAALAMLLTVFLHPQLDRVAQTVTKQPFVAGSVGLLTALLAPITVVILVVTLILIPVALAAVVLLVLAWLFGVVAFGIEVGDRFTKDMGAGPLGGIRNIPARDRNWDSQSRPLCRLARTANRRPCGSGSGSRNAVRHTRGTSGNAICP